jgi:hypothetical protein
VTLPAIGCTHQIFLPHTVGRVAVRTDDMQRIDG